MMGGIGPNSVTLAALLLVVTEAAEVAKVPLDQVADTLLQIDLAQQAADDADAADADEPKISWPN